MRYRTALSPEKENNWTKREKENRTHAAPRRNANYELLRGDRRPATVGTSRPTVALVAADLANAGVAKLTAILEAYFSARGYALLVSRGTPAMKTDGLVAIGANKIHAASAPAISIDLHGMLLEGPLSAETSEWLQETGNAAGRAILRKIGFQKRRAANAAGISETATLRNRVVRTVSHAA